MEQEILFDKIKKIGIVPVVKLEDAQDAKPLAKALCDGGLPCAEVTFRTEQAADAIKNMKEAYPEKTSCSRDKKAFSIDSDSSIP